MITAEAIPGSYFSCDADWFAPGLSITGKEIGLQLVSLPLCSNLVKGFSESNIRLTEFYMLCCMLFGFWSFRTGAYANRQEHSRSQGL
jgi:hypothetical protein